MFPDKTKFKKATRFALLFYSIFMGISGTIMLSVVILWVIPEDQLSGQVVPLSILALPLYGSCIAALIIRAIFFKKEGISSD